MNYYKFHIGDYRRDTSHLSLLEHGIYRQMLDLYYLSESSLTSDVEKLMRMLCVRIADEVQAFKNVLADFFVLTENGYEQSRCMVIISEYQSKSGKASKSANARWRREKENKNANAMRTHSEGNAIGMLTTNHKPLTTNQEKKKKELSSKPDDSVMEVFRHWQKVMGTEKAKASPERISKIKARLKDYTVSQLKEAVDGCRKSEHHMGKNDRKTKYNDIELICRDCKHVDSFLQEHEEENSLITGKGWAN